MTTMTNVTIIDNQPLIGSPDRVDVPWWAAKGSRFEREQVLLLLPDSLVEALRELQDQLGIAASDLVASYVQRGVEDARSRRRRFLDDLDDPSRIKGWMPSGTPILKTGE